MGERPERPEAEDIGMTVHVSNIANTVTEDRLGSLFGAYGEVRHTRPLHSAPCVLIQIHSRSCPDSCIRSRCL